MCLDLIRPNPVCERYQASHHRGPKRIVDLREYIEARSMPVTETGCWLWLLRTDRNGYGIASLRNSYIGAHQVSFHAFFGPIPDGRMVCHKCDVRSCVNPNHIYAGTAKENMRDMVRRGRYQATNPKTQGERNIQAKLSIDDVMSIRASQESQREIAERFGISQSTVSRLRNGRYWSWLSAQEVH